MQVVKERLEEAHKLLQEQQVKVRQEDEKPPLFAVGDLVWMENKRRRKGENPKLQPKFVGPYEVLEVLSGHTYRVERQHQQSVQHESRLKPYRACEEPVDQAPTTLEPARRPNIKGVAAKRKEKPRETKPEWLPDLDQPAANEDAPAKNETEREPALEPEPGPSETPNAGVHSEVTPVDPPVAAPPTNSRPTRSRHPPQS